MAGTPKPGRITDLSIDAVLIGGIQDATLEISRNAIDVTNKDDAGWDSFINGQGSASISGTCVYEEDDAGQEDLIDAILAGSDTLNVFVFRPWGASVGADMWTWNGMVTSANVDSPNKDALSFPITIQLSGAPTRADQV